MIVRFAAERVEGMFRPVDEEGTCEVQQIARQARVFYPDYTVQFVMEGMHKLLRRWRASMRDMYWRAVQVLQLLQMRSRVAVFETRDLRGTVNFLFTSTREAAVAALRRQSAHASVFLEGARMGQGTNTLADTWRNSLRCFQGTRHPRHRAHMVASHNSVHVCVCVC